MLVDYVLRTDPTAMPDFFGLRMGHRVGSVILSLPAHGEGGEHFNRRLNRQGWKTLVRALESNAPTGFALRGLMVSWQDCRTGAYGVEAPLDSAGAYNRTLALDPAQTLRFYRAHAMVTVDPAAPQQEYKGDGGGGGA